ncbi:MAG: helix-turn-helix transcriptional regulator [Chloroflexi bacterium]|nr:MAG: helix-turn-helix transcriptional regulator [Chloroflexota bacterium]
MPSRIRLARQRAGLSMAALGEGLVSRAAIHLIENGKSKPSMGLLQTIVARTGKPIEYFIATNVTAQPRRVSSEVDVVDHLHAAERGLSRLLRQVGLTRAEREGGELLLLSLRQGIRFVSTVRLEKARAGRGDRHRNPARAANSA